jgi:hypothetical protein
LTQLTALQPAPLEALSQRMALDLPIWNLLCYKSCDEGKLLVGLKIPRGVFPFFLKDTTIKVIVGYNSRRNNLAYEKRADILYVMTESRIP